MLRSMLLAAIAAGTAVYLALRFFGIRIERLNATTQRFNIDCGDHVDLSYRGLNKAKVAVQVRSACGPAMRIRVGTPGRPATPATPGHPARPAVPENWGEDVTASLIE